MPPGIIPLSYFQTSAVSRPAFKKITQNRDEDLEASIGELAITQEDLEKIRENFINGFKSRFGSEQATLLQQYFQQSSAKQSSASSRNVKESFRELRRDTEKALYHGIAVEDFFRLSVERAAGNYLVATHSYSIKSEAWKVIRENVVAEIGKNPEFIERFFKKFPVIQGNAISGKLHFSNQEMDDALACKEAQEPQSLLDIIERTCDAFVETWTQNSNARSKADLTPETTIPETIPSLSQKHIFEQHAQNIAIITNAIQSNLQKELAVLEGEIATVESQINSLKAEDEDFFKNPANEEKKTSKHLHTNEINALKLHLEKLKQVHNTYDDAKVNLKNARDLNFGTSGNRFERYFGGRGISKLTPIAILRGQHLPRLASRQNPSIAENKLTHLYFKQHILDCYGPQAVDALWHNGSQLSVLYDNGFRLNREVADNAIRQAEELRLAHDFSARFLLWSDSKYLPEADDSYTIEPENHDQFESFWVNREDGNNAPLKLPNPIDRHRVTPIVLKSNAAKRTSFLNLKKQYQNREAWLSLMDYLKMKGITQETLKTLWHIDAEEAFNNSEPLTDLDAKDFITVARRLDDLKQFHIPNDSQAIKEAIKNLQPDPSDDQLPDPANLLTRRYAILSTLGFLDDKFAIPSTEIIANQNRRYLLKIYRHLASKYGKNTADSIWSDKLKHLFITGVKPSLQWQYRLLKKISEDYSAKIKTARAEVVTFTDTYLRDTRVNRVSLNLDANAILVLRRSFLAGAQAKISITGMPLTSEEMKKMAQDMHQKLFFKINGSAFDSKDETFGEPPAIANAPSWWNRIRNSIHKQGAKSVDIARKRNQQGSDVAQWVQSLTIGEYEDIFRSIRKLAGIDNVLTLGVEVGALGLLEGAYFNWQGPIATQQFIQCAGFAEFLIGTINTSFKIHKEQEKAKEAQNQVIIDSLEYAKVYCYCQALEKLLESLSSSEHAKECEKIEAEIEALKPIIDGLRNKAIATLSKPNDNRSKEYQIELVAYVFCFAGMSLDTVEAILIQLAATSAISAVDYASGLAFGIMGSGIPMILGAYRSYRACKSVSRAVKMRNRASREFDRLMPHGKVKDTVSNLENLQFSLKNANSSDSFDSSDSSDASDASVGLLKKEEAEPGEDDLTDQYEQKIQDDTVYQNHLKYRKAKAKITDDSTERLTVKPHTLITSDIRADLAKSVKRNQKLALKVAQLVGATLNSAGNVGGTVYGIVTTVKIAAVVGAATGAIGGTPIIPGLGTAVGAAVGGILASVGGMVAATSTFVIHYCYKHRQVREEERKLNEWRDAAVQQSGPKWKMMRDAGISQEDAMVLAFHKVIRRDLDIALDIMAEHLILEQGKAKEEKLITNMIKKSFAPHTEKEEEKRSDLLIINREWEGSIDSLASLTNKDIIKSRLSEMLFPN